ncbi:MAG: M3 family metallopeptidase [Kofleriaceae bacterium]
MASQWFERYLATPEVIARFTRHDTTAQPMPAALVERIERARNFAEGIRTMAMLQTSVLDLDLHTLPVPPDFGALERAIAAAVHAPPEVSAVGGAVQAGFLFGGENYAAQFYSYLWSDALAAEVYEAFLAGTGPYDRTVAERLRAHVLATGDSLPPADAYRRVLGKVPGIDALLRKRGMRAPGHGPGSRQAR